jgi:hypothetical protein
LHAGAEKRSDETIWNIFLDKMSNPMFNATMSVNPFESKISHLRFDEKQIRANSLKDDYLAPISNIMEFVCNCRHSYKATDRRTIAGISWTF